MFSRLEAWLRSNPDVGVPVVVGGLFVAAVVLVTIGLAVALN